MWHRRVGQGALSLLVAVNILWLLQPLPLTQKATLGSKPNFPIMPSINLVTLARKAKEKSVCLASGLISTHMPYLSCW